MKCETEIKYAFVYVNVPVNIKTEKKGKKKEKKLKEMNECFESLMKVMRP